jgi:MFS family permease
MSQDHEVAPGGAQAPKLHSIPIVALYIAASVAMLQIMGAFYGLKLSFLYKDVLHLTASGMATLGIITGIPSYLRPFMGAMSDLFPIFGFHRKSYYGISWLLAAFGFALLASLHSYQYHTVVCLVIVVLTGGTLLMVMVDAVMVSIGNMTGSVGPLQAIQQGVQSVLGLTFIGPLSGYVAQHWSYQHCFTASAVVCVLSAPLAMLIPETRVLAHRQAHEDEEQHRARTEARRGHRAQLVTTLRTAAATPGIWAIVGFVFYLIITPGTNTAQFYYTVDVLHFSKQFLGDLSIPGSAGGLLGILFFAFASRRMPVRAIVWGAFLMDCSIYLLLMGLHNQMSGIILTFVGAFVGSLYNLCLFTLAARACPPGIEGTIYGLVISAIALGGSLGEKIGSSIYDYFGPAHHHTTAHGWFALLWFGFAFTVAAIVFIPFLPAWTRSNEPLRPGPAAVEVG